MLSGKRIDFLGGLLPRSRLRAQRIRAFAGSTEFVALCPIRMNQILQVIDPAVIAATTCCVEH
jgi:hypothetical protein